MARVTVEDCIEKVANRFKLVLMAAKRARDLERGAKPSVVRDNDKSTILALREIAEEAISLENLESLTKQNIINDEAELPYENEEVQLRSDSDTNEDDDEFDDEALENEDDDDWETSDNPYNRRIPVDDNEKFETYDNSDEQETSEDDSDDEYEDNDEEELDEEYDEEDIEDYEDDLDDDVLDEDDDLENEK